MMMHGFGLSFGIMWLIGAVVVLGLSAVFVRWLGGRFSQHHEGSAGGRHPHAARSEADIYRLAGKLGGRLMVSDLVVHLGFSPREAEKLLVKMTDGLRVRMEVNDGGSVVFEFTEIISRSGGTASDNDKS